MLKELGTAALKDFIGFLKQEKDFFTLERKVRTEKIQAYFSTEFPLVFTQYLEAVSADDFLREIKHAVDVFEQAAYADSRNQFLIALAHYISEDFAQRFDQLDIAFFFIDFLKRSHQLEALFPGKNTLSYVSRDLILKSTYQEICIWANATLSTLQSAPFIVIQTPLELEASLRKDIRAHIVKRYPFSFPEFQVNPQIIGGLRVFVGGEVIDHSWMGRIQSLANLAQLSK